MPKTLVSSPQVVRYQKEFVNRTWRVVPHIFDNGEKADEWAASHRWLHWVVPADFGGHKVLDAIDHRGE